MADPAYAIETEWLHDVVEGFCDVFFENEAEEDMRALGVTRPEIMAVLRTAAVVNSDREEAGWRWEVEGSDCDDRLVIVTLRVETNVLCVEVVRVRRG